MKAALNLFMPVTDYLTGLLKMFPYQQCDETKYLVISEKDHTTNFIWIHRTSECAETNPIIIYCYEPSRAADHLFDFYDEMPDEMYLTCDGYSAYISLEQNFPYQVFICGCWAHDRRYWVDAFRIATKGMEIGPAVLKLVELEALERIYRVYEAESKLRGLPPEEKYIRRQADVKPYALDYIEFVDSLDENDPLYSDALRKAIVYTKNHKEEFLRFLEDGNIPIDDMATERNVKVVATLRKNSLFSYSEDGARATMICMSLIETAKANGAAPYYYLKYLLDS